MGPVLFLAALSFASPAKVLTVVGTVEAKLDGEYESIARFDSLDEGTELRTQSRSRATLRLASGTLLRLGPQTTLILAAMKHDKQLRAKRKESLKLTAGRVWASVLSLFGSDSKFEVEGRTAVAGVRGTSFFMSTDENGDEVVLEEGSLSIRIGDELFALDAPGESFSSSTRTIGLFDAAAIAQIQRQTGGSASQAIEQLGMGPSTESPGGPTLQVRQEINGQDEVVDSGITLDNDPSNETRDLAEVIIELVPET